jgi:hypothetical protein
VNTLHIIPKIERANQINYLFIFNNVGSLLSCIGPVYTGIWPVCGRYQTKQEVSQHSTMEDTNDESFGIMEIRTHDVADKAPKPGKLPLSLNFGPV